MQYILIPKKQYQNMLRLAVDIHYENRCRQRTRFSIPIHVHDILHFFLFITTHNNNNIFIIISIIIIIIIIIIIY